jgi:hypothetical protein
MTNSLDSHEFCDLRRLDINAYTIPVMENLDVIIFDEATNLPHLFDRCSS